MKIKTILIGILCITSIILHASAYYVSADATGNGDGSFDNPWQLQQALNSPATLNNPIDTVWVWLKEGIYTNKYDAQSSFSCYTNGNKNAPIIFRNYKNQRVTIDSKQSYSLVATFGHCSYTWFWGIEVYNSDTSDRDHPSQDRLGNVLCSAPNMKFINMIVHDMGSGIDTWKTASNTETYGCLVYNIGNNLKNGTNWEGHGHGMYLQNDTIGTKNIHNNIVFNTFGYGIKIWQTTTTDAIGNFDVQNNIVFNGGAASENLGGVGSDSRTHNFFVVSNGTNNPIINSVFKHNYTYAGINTPRPPVNAFGLNYGVKNMTLDSNFLTCQTRLGFNNTPVFTGSVKGNKFIAGIPSVYGYYLWGFTNTDFIENQYIANVPTTGLDYFFMPNKYDPNRTHLVIYNWSGDSTVNIDAAHSGLIPEENYELINVMDYYNDKIKFKMPQDGFLHVPMSGHSFGQVIGSQKASVSQFPYFGVFIIVKSEIPTSTNIFNYKQDQILHIYPNPAHKKLEIVLSNAKPGKYELTIFDNFGKNIELNKSIFLQNNQQLIEVNIENLPLGNFILKLNNAKAEYIGKFIKI